MSCAKLYYAIKLVNRIFGSGTPNTRGPGGTWPTTRRSIFLVLCSCNWLIALTIGQDLMHISQGFQQAPLVVSPAWTGLGQAPLRALCKRVLPPALYDRCDQEMREFQIRLAGRTCYRDSSNPVKTT